MMQNARIVKGNFAATDAFRKQRLILNKLILNKRTKKAFYLRPSILNFTNKCYFILRLSCLTSSPTKRR